LILKIKKLHPSAKLPTRAHVGDAGIDIYAVERVVLNPGQRVAIKTGISMEVPEGHVGLIWDKSSIAIKQGLKTLGGVIDAGYRGEVLIGMVNLGDVDYTFEAGHKVAQLLIQRVEFCEIAEVTDLSESIRWEGGFGSTGK
jgi:dUTP pyrophosphatase